MKEEYQNQLINLKELLVEGDTILDYQDKMDNQYYNMLKHYFVKFVEYFEQGLLVQSDNLINLIKGLKIAINKSEDKLAGLFPTPAIKIFNFELSKSIKDLYSKLLILNEDTLTEEQRMAK